MSDVGSAKTEVRQAVRRRLALLTGEQRASFSARICVSVRQQEAWSRARSVLFYAPLPDEVDIEPLLEEALLAGKRVALPRFHVLEECYRACQIEESLANLGTGRFRIREPGPSAPLVELDDIDMFLVPGIAFDLNGHRLGRGGGFYDRLLAGRRGVKCGLAFDEQVCPQIPVEAHDILLDCIVTPSGWRDCRRRRLGDDLAG